jgi:hypothetical protein
VERFARCMPAFHAVGTKLADLLSDNTMWGAV